MNIQKIKDFLRHRVFAKKIWRWPRQSKVLIFDACGQEYLLYYLSPWEPEVLHVRGERINVLVFLASLFKRGKRNNAYVDTYIKKVSPHLIVTFIDNNPSFFTISQRHPDIKTLFIQNGWRGYYADVFELLDKMDEECHKKMKVDYMMTFGEVSGREYTKYIAGTVVPIGSLKNNWLNKVNLAQKGTIAFVSQWQSEDFYMGDTFCSSEVFFKQVESPVLKHLAVYAKQHKKKLVIIPRYKKTNEKRLLEESYYEEILGPDAEFIESSNDNYPSYHAVDVSEVVVTIDSTLGYESIARGNKTAIFSIRSSMLDISGLTYGWPASYGKEGLFWCNELDTKSFERILNYLFSTDTEQWKKDVGNSGFSSLMIYDPGNIKFKSLLSHTLDSLVFRAG